ncbi:MAG: Lysine 2,3-aminomutase [Pseudomonadota bacterium]|jgi:lysine 2,3-aminomutase
MTASSLPRLQVAESGLPADSADWRWQLREALTTADQLNASLELTQDEYLAAKHAEEQGFPISITPYYRGLIQSADPACPIRRQVVPTLGEQFTSPSDLRDPLGEEAHQVAPELVQRYPDRALLLATDRCSVYCRFCTRSRLVGQGGGVRSADKLAPALEYLRAHPAIRDVIVSGGDPLVMATSKLASLLERLRAIESIETIRLATRVPVTLPQRIQPELLSALRPFHPLWVMTHFNHPRELTEESRAACVALADAGFPVMNQTVLLAGVNDDAETLTALFRGLVRVRVRPYYLLQMDPVRGTSHLRTPLRVGEEIMRQLTGRLSGIALPKFIVDTPGGFGKVPAGPSFVVERGEGYTRFQSPRGNLVDYFDPAV